MEFKNWIPVPDRRKPNLPYKAGLELHIRPHVPPRPFGNAYLKGAYPRQRADKEDLREETASSWSLSHPVLDTSMISHDKPRTLKVIGKIACEDGRGAQIMRCTLDNDDDPSHVYVAKVYDPLYYSFVSKETGLPVDVTYSADHDYSRETCAYQQLKQSGVDGELVPKYHGSWTFDMSLHKEPDVRRSVRMILLDWVPGQSMHSVMKTPDFARMSPQHRLDILGAALEVHCLVEFHKVYHGDFAPRNVLLVGDDIDVQMPRIMLVDFNLSSTYTDSNSRRRGTISDRPFSPRHQFWSSCPVEFEAWCPPPHRHEKPVFKGWLKRRWDGAPDFAAEPPEGLAMFRQYDEPVEEAAPMEDRDFYPPPDSYC